MNAPVLRPCRLGVSASGAPSPYACLYLFGNGAYPFRYKKTSYTPFATRTHYLHMQYAAKKALLDDGLKLAHHGALSSALDARF
jgi:hypothetical protein